MTDILLYGILSLIVGSFIYLDGYNITKNTIVPKWKRFRKVNKLVSKNYKGIFRILYISISLIIKALWINIIQYMNNTIIKIDKNTYIITYVVNGNIYKMKVTKLRGPSKVLMVTDENNEDVSDIIIPYMGVEQNFHNNKYKVDFFKRKELAFQLSNGDEKVFEGDNEIVL